MKFKSALVRWREHHKLSQAAAARILGVKAQSSVHGWEVGNECPDPATRARLTRVTGRLGPFAVTMQDFQDAWEHAHKADMKALDREIRSTYKKAKP